MSGNASSTEGTIATDVQLSGRAAAMGQGVIQDVSATLVKTSAANLAEMLSGPGPAAEEAPALAAPAPAEQPAPTAEQSLPVGAIAKSVAVGRPRAPRFCFA